MVPVFLIGRVMAAEKERRGTWASEPGGPDDRAETKSRCYRGFEIKELVAL